MMMQLKLKFRDGFEDHINLWGDKYHPVQIENYISPEQDIVSWYVESRE